MFGVFACTRGVYGISKCKFCENLRLRTLRSRLEVFEKESSVFPRRAPEASAALRESATLRDQSPQILRTVEIAHNYLYPSPEARDTVSFGLDDVLLTAASDFEDFGPALADAFPPSGQEVRPSAAYSELVDVLFPAPLRSSLWIGSMSPTSLICRSSTSSSP